VLDDSEMLQRLRKESIRLHNCLQTTAPPRRTGTIGPRLRRALAAMGYVSDGNDRRPPSDRLIPGRLPAGGFAAEDVAGERTASSLGSLGLSALRRSSFLGLGSSACE
jgi:hypothetical protein